MNPFYVNERGLTPFFTLTVTIRVGPGGGVHAGFGAVGSTNISEGYSSSEGCGGWVAGAEGGSGFVDYDRSSGSISGGGIRGEAGVGGAIGLQKSYNCTGCEDLDGLTGLIAQPLAFAQAMECVAEKIQDYVGR